MGSSKSKSSNTSNTTNVSGQNAISGDNLGVAISGVNNSTINTTMTDELIGHGDGVRASFQLVRNYGDNQANIGADAITFTAFKGKFISSVNEVGDIESSSNIEIRCRVKSRGREGVAILDLVSEGTKVEKGDFLCQLDDFYGSKINVFS